MNFDLNNSFEQNLSLFRVEAEKIDAECATILFENLSLLETGNDSTFTRAMILEFNQAIAAALDALPQPAEDHAS